jgi:hypothetical protein
MDFLKNRYFIAAFIVTWLPIREIALPERTAQPAVGPKIGDNEILHSALDQ